MPSLLFTPIEIGGVTLKNRLIMTAIGDTREQVVSDRVIDFYVARARGGVACIITGIVFNVHPSGRQSLEAFGLDDDKYTPALKKMVEAIQSAGAKVIVQLGHRGRAMCSRHDGSAPVAPSPIPDGLFKDVVPVELTGSQVQELVEAFAQAARRCRDAGADGVEFHGGHGYLLTQFMSPLSNKRSDEYGGSPERRARFATDILRRTREITGQDYVLSYRMSAEERQPGGLTLEDNKQITPLLVRAGANIINVSMGNQTTWWLPVPCLEEKAGCYAAIAGGIKSVTDVPILAVGRIRDPRLAERILKEGNADLIGMCRPLLADPELPNKALQQRYDDIRECIGCNVGCMQWVTDRRKDPTCLQNVEVLRERELKIVPVRTRKKVVVIGAGPAGLEAGRVCAERGHRVVIYEREGQVGGQLNLVARLPQMGEYAGVIRWLNRQVRQLGVQVRLRQEATPQLVESERPDSVVIACGATLSLPGLPDMRQAHVVTYRDVLSGKVSIGKNVAILNQRMLGVELAGFLLTRAERISIVEIIECNARRPRATETPLEFLHKRQLMSGGLPDMYHARYLFERLKAAGVSVIVATELVAVEQETIKLAYDGRTLELSGYDTVVWAHSQRANSSFVDRLKDVIGEIQVIGDAKEPRTSLDAIHEGSLVARGI